MFDSQIGVAVGFLLLSIVSAWIFINIKLSLITKLVGIFILVYYMVAVFFTMQNILGWPIESDLPPNAKIISVRIVEPSGVDKGGMWFWLNEKPELKKDLMNLMRPDKVFIYTGQLQPRSYRIPYDRELHKKLIETKKKQNGGGILMTGIKGVKGKNKSGGYSNDKLLPPFRILNPSEILTK